MLNWQITQENLALLEDVEHIDAGTLDLRCTEADKSILNQIARFVQEHGNLLHSLFIRPKHWKSEADFERIDFVTNCPHLRVLNLKRGRVNESVFVHPTLERLELLEVTCRGPQEILIGDEASEGPLQMMSMMDCNISAKTFTIGPAAQLKTFRYYLDEDFSESDILPSDFVFQACPYLEEITIHACAAWTILIDGLLPQLEYLSLDGQQYGSYLLKIQGVNEEVRMRYRRMLG